MRNEKELLKEIQATRALPKELTEDEKAILMESIGSGYLSKISIKRAVSGKLITKLGSNPPEVTPKGAAYIDGSN